MRWCLAAAVAIVPHAMALAARRKKPRRPPRSARRNHGADDVQCDARRAERPAAPRPRASERAICLADVRTNDATAAADHCWLMCVDARQFDETPIDASTTFDAEVAPTAGGPRTTASRARTA